MWNRTCRDLLRLFLLSLAVRLVLATLIRRPGYMNVAYYAAGAVRLAQGNGLSQPFLWNYLDDLAGSVAAVVLCMQIIRWRPRPWLWAATTLWCVLMYHDLQALILGQFAVFVLLALEGNFERAPVYFPFPAMVGLLLAWLWRRIWPGNSIG